MSSACSSRKKCSMLGSKMRFVILNLFQNLLSPKASVRSRADFRDAETCLPAGRQVQHDELLIIKIKF